MHPSKAIITLLEPMAALCRNTPFHTHSFLLAHILSLSSRIIGLSQPRAAIQLCAVVAFFRLCSSLSTWKHRYTKTLYIWRICIKMSYTSLRGKVVLITGASSGLGRATAIHFASLGSRLVVCGRNDAALQETVSQCAGADDVISIVGDITVETDVVNIIERTIEHYKQLDVLINNAGILKRGGIQESTLDDYDTLMNVNLRSVYHLTMLAVPHLIVTKGAIVNVSSIGGFRASAQSLVYCMTKAALDQFTRCVALDLAPKQVRVNSVNPGMIPTKMVTDILPKEKLDEFLEVTKRIYPLSRVGEPEDVAKAIAFLASSESSFTTGTQLPIDGGFNLACPR